MLLLLKRRGNGLAASGRNRVMMKDTKKPFQNYRGMACPCPLCFDGTREGTSPAPTNIRLNADFESRSKYFMLALAIFVSLAFLPIVAGSQTQAREQNSRLVVSFYSICCGIDHTAKEKLDRFINSYEKAMGKQLTKATVHWGREGEIDYCFQLSELLPKEQKRFISKVRLLLRKSKLVHINENASCKSER
jgi:hypothetical protein